MVAFPQAEGALHVCFNISGAAELSSLVFPYPSLFGFEQGGLVGIMSMYNYQDTPMTQGMVGPSDPE